MAEAHEARLTAAGNEMSASFLAAKKRSDETLAKLEENPGKFTMLTGDRPTGRLHLGHFFGSIKSVWRCRTAASTRTSSSPTIR